MHALKLDGIDSLLSLAVGVNVMHKSAYNSQSRLTLSMISMNGNTYCSVLYCIDFIIITVVHALNQL